MLDAQVVEQEIAADAGVRDRLDAMEGVVGLDEGEHRVRQERHRRYALEAIEQVMRPALAGEAGLLRHVERGAVPLEPVVARQVKQHGNDLAWGVGMGPQRIVGVVVDEHRLIAELELLALDRKSTRLNSSHTVISYAVFCLKKKKKKKIKMN